MRTRGVIETELMNAKQIVKCLEKELENPSRTYHIGQRFSCHGEELILAASSYRICGLIHLKNGNRALDFIPVGDVKKITSDELYKMCYYGTKNLVLVEDNS